MRQWTTPAALALLFTLGACQGQAQRTLRDSEGRSFRATCERRAPCRLEQLSGPVQTDKPALTLHTQSRLVGVCDVKAGAEVEGSYDCRALTCVEDQDCPPLHGMKDGQCLNGRCSDPALPLAQADAVMLCLAGTGLGRSSPQQIERYALALNCGSPCQVPAPCAQP